MSRLFALLLACCLGAPLSAQNTNVDFATYLEQQVWPLAQRQGIARATFNTALSGVRFNADLPGLRPSATNPQAEFRHPSRYFTNSGLRNAAGTGQQLYRQYQQTLAAIELQTGVPGHIILAIWGRESSYGRADIPNDAFQVLASLGYASRRADYFTSELIAALRMLDSGAASRAQMRSSWAGALGQPQFMPSNYLTYARDGDGDGRADIWGSAPDTLASIGYYLREHGWVAGRDWGFEVTLPASVSCTLEGPDQGRRISEWAAMGVTRTRGRDFPANEARQTGTLLLPAGRDGPAFIVTPNFYVLKDYNESDAYALFVGHVGDRIAYNSPAFDGAWGNGGSFSVAQVRNAQLSLERMGMDVGGADGLVGFKTRRSLGRWQEAQGRSATCYPDRATINALQ